MSEKENPLYDSSKMVYRYLGDSGLRVSVLSFGVMLHDNVENMKEIKEYILEWYKNDEYKKKMCDAILDTQELLMNSKFSSTFCCDKDI